MQTRHPSLRWTSKVNWVGPVQSPISCHNANRKNQTNQTRKQNKTQKKHTNKKPKTNKNQTNKRGQGGTFPVYLSNQHIELEQRRPAHAKPDFTWLLGPRNGTWKRTCGIRCGDLRCSTTQATFTNPIDTISKRWRSKKAFNTSPCHIFS